MAIRNLGYIAWKNDLSWLESQKGEKWESLIKKENNEFNSALKGLHKKIENYEAVLNPSVKGSKTVLNGWTVDFAPFSPEQTFTHIKSGFSCKCWDADMSEDMFIAAVQDPDGYERFTVEIYSLNGKAKPGHLKTVKNAGPTVALLKGEPYYLGSDADLRYSKVLYGLDETLIYQTENLEENLEILRGEDGSAYVVNSTFSKKQYAMLPKLNKWEKEPHLKSCIVSESMEPLESISLKAGWKVTKSRGIRTLWNTKTNKPVLWVWGDISYDPRNPFIIYISDIRYESYVIKFPEWKLSNPEAHSFPCSYHEHPLPAFVVHPEDIQNIRGLLINAYGAYGTPTHVGSLISRWKPLLLEGWIIASVMVPGSGDHGKAWVREGQRKNRIKSIDAFRASIEALKEEYGIDASRTALYGRSAGGLLVSSVCIANPGLVGAIYIESPYVDVLRTITNPKLPLTTLETTEFGSYKDPVNILTTASWSPMEHIPVEGIPELFVIARTDTADIEVLPYEPLKFIQRVRGPEKNGKKKLIFVHKGLGHFTTSWKSRAEDLALLENWLKQSPGQESIKKPAVRRNNLTPKYKMPMTRKNRATRKNRDRKDRKDRASRKNRNMMGGRKHRKGSRKH